LIKDIYCMERFYSNSFRVSCL